MFRCFGKTSLTDAFSALNKSEARKQKRAANAGKSIRILLKSGRVLPFRRFPTCAVRLQENFDAGVMRPNLAP